MRKMTLREARKIIHDHDKQQIERAHKRTALAVKRSKRQAERDAKKRLVHMAAVHHQGRDAFLAGKPFDPPKDETGWDWSAGYITAMAEAVRMVTPLKIRTMAKIGWLGPFSSRRS